MPANVDAMVRAGIEAYRANKKTEARKLLEKAIELDDYNEQAWMWLSAVVETPEEQKTCLENVLVINPDNEEAQRGIKMLGTQESSPAKSTPASDSSPFAAAEADPFGAADFAVEKGDASESDDFSVPPTASSSASSTFQGNDLTASDYDDWVSNLGLGSGEEDSAAASAEPASPGFTGSTEIDDMFSMGDDDNFFGTDDPFGSETSLDDDDDASSAFTAGPFGGGDAMDDDLDIGSAPQTKAKPPAKSTAPSMPVQSPGAENFNSDDSLFADLDSADFSSTSEFSGGDFFIGGESEQGGSDELSPDEYFGFIPSEISATRLPGMKESVPVASLLITIILVLLNAGAIAFLATSLAG